MNLPNKYKLCKSCRHSRISTKSGIICNITQCEAKFARYCPNFNISQKRDLKIERRHNLNQIIETISIYTIGAVFMILMLTKLNLISITSFSIYIAFLFWYKKTQTSATKLQNEAGDFAYHYVTLSCVIIQQDDSNLHDKHKILYQNLIRLYGYNIAKTGIQLIKTIINQQIELNFICNKISKIYTVKEKTQLYYFLYEIAVLNNEINYSETHIINTIATKVGITERLYEFVKSRIIIEKKEESHQQEPFEYGNLKKQNLLLAYQILGLNTTASDEDIKRKFRKLAIENHPDKFSDEEDKLKAEAKFQEISAAYVFIKKEKGLR